MQLERELGRTGVCTRLQSGRALPEKHSLVSLLSSVIAFTTIFKLQIYYKEETSCCQEAVCFILPEKRGDRLILAAGFLERNTELPF